MGVYSQSWGNLDIDAPEWLGGYHFICSWRAPDGRSAGMPEFRVASRVAPALLLALLYQECRPSFAKGILPIEFQIGKEELDFQRKLRSLIPPPPTIWAEREFLRFCLSYLDKGADWSKEDYSLRFAVADEQLRIEGRLQKIFCPARGSWLGVSTVSARDLFRRLPRRFVNIVVVLQQKGNGLLIDGRLIPAHWEESVDSNGQEGR